STWKLPIYFPGDNAKTVNHIKDALGRFKQTRGIADGELSSVWFTLFGAATALGIYIASEFVAHQPTQSAPLTDRVAPRPEPTAADPRLIRQLEALADQRADELLASLSFD